MMTIPPDLTSLCWSMIVRCGCRSECQCCWLFTGGTRLVVCFQGLGEVSVRGVVTGRIGWKTVCANRRCARPDHFRGGRQYNPSTGMKLDNRLRDLLSGI